MHLRTSMARWRWRPLTVCQRSPCRSVTSLQAHRIPRCEEACDCDRAARDRQRDRQTRGTAVLRCANSRLVITRPVPRQEPVPLRNRPQSIVVCPPRKHCARRALLPLPPRQGVGGQRLRRMGAPRSRRLVGGERVKSDIQIAQEAQPRPIVEIGAEAGLHEDELELYGRYKAKVLPAAYARLRNRPDGKLVIVTCMTPTVAGEGKTTTTIGLAQGLAKIGPALQGGPASVSGPLGPAERRAVVTIREAAMGPVFGVKGGAAGGGYSQVIPMEDINLHFTGDMHAITAANNLLAAMVDNHLQQGNALGIDARRITWRRCLDVNDRALRDVIIGLGGPTEGVPRESGLDITPASEVMAVFCLAADLADLTERLGRIVVGYTHARDPIRASDLKAQGAMTALLKDAINPNLVQTLEGGPALIHGGPFGNIAHGTNSIRATRLALKLGEYALVETGFGADLGFEKFCDIVARQASLTPAGVVIVASARALKL